MRRLMLVLMIALLPIRGWVGDVMATEMVSVHVNAAGIAATADVSKADRLPSGMNQVMGGHSECDGHMATSPALDSLTTAPSTEPRAATDDSCSTCTTCQVCHTVAVAADSVATTAVPGAHTTVARPEARFASAEAALGFKPPIS